MKKQCIKVESKNAQKMHAFLAQEGLLSKGLKPVREKEFVFFPLEKNTLEKQLKKIISLGKGTKLSVMGFEENQKVHKTLKQALAGKLSKKELSMVNRAFDLLGNIAIVEIPKELSGKEKIIGQALLETQKGVQTVCMKTGAHKGVFRAEPVKVIAGKKNLVATYRESGCIFKIHLGKVFFSPRLGQERLRIAKLAKEDETVAVLFAGVGPFAVVLAKNSLVKKVFAVELNPVAVADMKENIKLNKVQEKVMAVLGDVKKIVPKKLAGLCDRVLMPLPKDAELFLPQAIACLSSQGGIIHFYGFGEKENPFEKAIETIGIEVEKAGRKMEVLGKKELREYSPDTVQIVVDFRVFS